MHYLCYVTHVLIYSCIFIKLKFYLTGTSSASKTQHCKYPSIPEAFKSLCSSTIHPKRRNCKTGNWRGVLHLSWQTHWRGKIICGWDIWFQEEAREQPIPSAATKSQPLASARKLCHPTWWTPSSTGHKGTNPSEELQLDDKGAREDPLRPPWAPVFQ